MSSVPVVVVSTVDPVLREVLALSALSDLPGTAVIRQDLDPHHGLLHRVVTDTAGVVEREEVLLEHACSGCAVREDLLPTVARLVDRGGWERIVVLSPVTAESTAASRALGDPVTAGTRGVTLAGVLSVVDADRVVDDLMGEDLVGDRELAITVDDNRSVGEALGAQLAHADLLLTVGADPTGLTLIDHLRGAGSSVSDLYAVAGDALFRRRHRPALAEARLDPRHVRPSAARDENGVWTMDLASDRPLHPERFLARIEDLGAGRVRSRGRFVLPTRLDTVCVWDGAGGQVSIGHGGAWAPHVPSTRLVFTGVGDERRRVRRAFASMVMTDAEMAADIDWRRTDDGLGDWLAEPG